MRVALDKRERRVRLFSPAGKTMTLLLVLLLLRLPARASDTVRESLSKWTPGRRIELVFNSGEKVIGRLGPVQSDRFTLKPDKRKGTDRELRFDEVRSASTKMTVGKKWAIAGGIYGVLLVLGLILGK